MTYKRSLAIFRGIIGRYDDVYTLKWQMYRQYKRCEVLSRSSAPHAEDVLFCTYYFRRLYFTRNIVDTQITEV